MSTLPARRSAGRLANAAGVACLTLSLASPWAAAQPAAASQPMSPPKAQAWIDVATFSGLSIPSFGSSDGSGGVAGALGALGGLLGGVVGAPRNDFGRTQTGTGGRWVDVTLQVRANPSLADAQQQVPAGFLPAPLQLKAPAPEKVTRQVPDDDERTIEPSFERPKGRLLLFWGCGAQARPGQPKVLDFATMNPQQLGEFFKARGATRRGAHSQVGRPHWPNPGDTRMVPAQASLAGEHRFIGAGVPENFNFQIPPAQDLMPPLNLQQQAAAGGATDLRWAALPTAKAYFASAIGMARENEMVLWTSSELPDAGFGLLDYQVPASVDGWLRERVLLAPNVSQCTIPAGVFASGAGAFLRVIAFGPQLNLAFPARPADRNARWDPDWMLQVRTKAVASAMLGMSGMGLPGMAGGGGEATAGAPASADEPAPKKPGALDVLRGIIGR